MKEQSFTINLTENALTKLKSTLASKPIGTFLRINISSGGCSGFMTSFNLDSQQNEEDIEISQDGVKVIIHKMIAEFIKEAELDYISGILSSYFKLTVKQATESCSCGSSFNI